MVRMAGNTMLTSVARFNAGITYESLLVPTGAVITNININGQFSSSNIASPRDQECIQSHNSATYEKDKMSSSRAQHIPAGFTTLTNSKSWRSRKRSSRKYFVPRNETLPKRREHCCSTSCKGAMENANTTSRSVGLHILYSFEANGRKRSRRTRVPATIHPKEKAKPLGSGFQLLGSGSQLPGSGSQLPTTLIPLFLAMYPDIPLKKTRPRGKHGKMSSALTKGATRINKSHQHARGKGDSRRGDKSSSDIQKTLGVARPSGGREQLGCMIK
ncbi:hypothetical protein F2Q68_00015244 [Brassica cretica]|uniref:Uncharacterized protein n=1 Tax=Brassica cretica TaxID=69181 RepID=A0A8S9HDN3_BRACR|nr:hypothetical protein F2Q68_00015244 [Brassica cretica]